MYIDISQPRAHTYACVHIMNYQPAQSAEQSVSYLREPRSFWEDAMHPTRRGFWSRTLIASFIPTAFISVSHLALFPRALLASAAGSAWNYHYWVERDIQRGETLKSAATLSSALGFGATTPFAIVSAGLFTNAGWNFAKAIVSIIQRPQLALRTLGRAGNRVGYYLATMGGFSLYASPLMCVGAAMLYFPGYFLMTTTRMDLIDDIDDDELSPNDH